jgi:VIT1/CCC1 family predicted Fe2+/Mn2+ transporter
MEQADAEDHAREVLSTLSAYTSPVAVQSASGDEHEAVGNGWSAAVSSFCFFASGALIPILPFLFGLTGTAAIIVSAVLVGLVLLGTGAVVGLLSGASPLKRAVRQLAIGYGAAAATYVLGLLFGATVG